MAAIEMLKCGKIFCRVRRMIRGMWDMKHEMWNIERGMWNIKHGLWDAKCRM